MKKIIIHPILFALFPILALYNHNKDMAQLSYLLWPVIISVLFAIALFFLLELIIKNKNKAAITVSLFLILFFSFGHILSMVPTINIGTLIIYNYYILSFILATLLIFTALLILTTKKSLNTINFYLNTVAIILIIFPLINIGLYEYKTKNIDINSLNITDRMANGVSESKKGKTDLPDIYYIILDGYARADILKEIYDYDNSDFINYLTNQGFYIANQSHANYPQTYLSIASSLNFEYINYLSQIMGENSTDRKPLKKMIKNNKVYQYLKNQGYLFAAFPSTWSGYYNNLNTDIYLHNAMDLNEFDNILINTTPLSIWLGKKIRLEWLRNKLLYTFDHLPDIAEIDSPTFTYVHILAPHPPFLFDEKGDPINPKGEVRGLDGDHYFKKHPDKEEYRKKYKNQLIFINKKITKMVEEILNKSKQPPIIILQADHGPGSETQWEKAEKTNMKERLSILNAYFLGDEGKKLLYETITPVNSFRVIFNYIFNTKFELLEDKSYFATWNHPYKFINVTEKLKSGLPVD